jgi:Ca-activated chloride channel family protein
MFSSIRVDHALVAVESEHLVHAMLEVTAPDVDGGDRPALHLALVIDRSGSMAGAKVEGAKQAARFLVERLGAEDSMALVAFDDEVSLLAPSEVPDKERLRDVIRQIGPRGSTNLSGGWLKGAEELRRAPGGGKKRVLLLTDGHANAGITDAGRLAGMVGGIAGEQITTTTIGFGRGFDENLLTAMADAGGGNGYFAAGPDDAPGIFSEEFEGLAAVASQNVSVEIVPIEEVRFIRVLHDYPTVSVPGGIQTQLGDFYGGETRRIIFELTVPNVAELGQKHIADVILRYTSVGEPVEMHQVTIPVHVNVVTADEADASVADRDIVDEVLILKAAEDRKRASDLADGGSYDDAAAILESTSESLRAVMADSSRSEEIENELLELGYVSRKLRRHDYDLYDKKRMHYESRRNLQSKPHDDWDDPDLKERW